MEKLTSIKAILRFFNDSSVASSYGYADHPVKTTEMKGLSGASREEMGKAACKLLGAEWESTSVATSTAP